MKTAVILTFSKVYNRGANIQCYALLKTLKSLGYNVRFLDIQQPKKDQNIKGRIFDLLSNLQVRSFRRKNGFVYTKPYYSYEELVRTSPNADILVIGSDQVWNNELISKMKLDPRIFYGGFYNGIKKIAYAASFGTDTWSVTQYDKEIIDAVGDLWAVSVREASGVKLCQDVFGRNDACCVVDPSLLLSRDDLEKLIDSNPFQQGKYTYVYLLHRDQKIDNLVDFLTKKMILPVKGDPKEYNLQQLFNIVSIPRWLTNIRDAEYVITNSFHCMVMCILFHKRFFVLPTFPGREIRMLSLLDNLHISDRYINQCTSIDIMSEINYRQVDELLDVLRNESMTFLTNALTC